MDATSTRALLVEPPDLDADFAVTATVPRSEVEEALSSDDPAELFLDVKRLSGDDAEERTVAIEWTREDLERLLADARGDAITFSFARDDLERAFEEEDVEAHGLRERAAILTVAVAAAAAASASTAAAGVDEGIGSSAAAPAITQVSHDEALTASQLATPGNDEAGLAARGIETSAVRDEATLASRGIETPQFTPAHDEALTASQIVTAPANDEASLAARGIEIGPVHDEATLASRGIDAPPAVHDEATLVDRGIQPAPVSVHDEATLAARGIEPTPVDGGSGFELPTVDATTAGVTAGIAGFALLITAAGFAARRGRGGPRPA